MEKIEGMIRAAHKKALSICKAYTTDIEGVAPEHQELVAMYIAKKVLKPVVKPVKITQGVYYPCLRAKEFDGLTRVTWLAIVRHAMEVHGIKSNLGMNSVNCYVLSAWDYEPECVNLLSLKEVGGQYSSMYKEEKDTWEMVKEEYNNDKV